MAYRRFVTYLFRYKNGKKEENCGFAKVEVRQDRARMEIQVRGVPDGVNRVYLFTLDDKENKKDLTTTTGTEGALLGVYIGNLTVRDGAGRERFAFGTDAVGGTPCGMEEMAGIYMKSAGGFLASQWVDEELDWDSFQEYEPPKTEKIADANAVVEPDPAESEKKMGIGQDSDAASENLPEQELMEREKEETQGEAAVYKDGTSVAGNEQLMADMEHMEGENEKSAELHATQAAAAVRVEAPQRPSRVSSYISTWERQWRQFTESHPLFCPFDEAPEILAVKMDLRDFKLLPKTYLPLAYNSFLLHGYFNYKYLLFGYMDGEPRRWFLGIPGVFQNQEQLLAGLFGFGEFRTKHLTRQKTGEFGYWYRYLEL